MIKYRMKKLVRPIFITILLLHFAFIFHYCRQSKNYDIKKPNIILIVSDALRKDVLGCYGGDCHTPNIDWLAQNGTLFENAYSTAPCTIPSSIGMFTGNYSVTYGRKPIPKGNKKGKRLISYIDDKEQLPAERLKSAGYLVKGDFENPLVKRSNSIQGFDLLGLKKDLSNIQITNVESQTGIKNIGWNKSFHISSNYDRLYSMLSFLLEFKTNKPFFLVKWFYDPHAPYNPPQKFRSKINPNDKKLHHPIEYYNTLQDRKINLLSSSYEKFVYLKQLYKAEVESLDERIGFLLTALRKKKILKNTIIIFTADHGELFGEHGLRGHTNAFYQPLVNVPLIFAGAGIPKKLQIKTKITHLGLMPTIWHLAGNQGKINCQGNSYAELFSQNRITESSPYFDSYGNQRNRLTSNCDALIHDDIKLIRKLENQKEKFELFDLSCDPEEQFDISIENFLLMGKMQELIEKIQKKNNMIMKKNMSRSNIQEDELKDQWEKTQKTLKSLGYIE